MGGGVASLFDDSLALAGLSSAASLAAGALPEREAVTNRFGLLASLRKFGNEEDNLAQLTRRARQDTDLLQQVWKLRRVLSGLAAEGNTGAGLELLAKHSDGSTFPVEVGLSHLPVRHVFTVTNALMAVLAASLASQLDAQPPRAFDTGPVERVGAILNVSAALTREDVLKGLEETDAAFAEQVRRAIFTFVHLPARLAARGDSGCRPQRHDRSAPALLAHPVHVAAGPGHQGLGPNTLFADG